MTSIAGHSTNILDAELEPVVVAAIARSSCKLLATGPDGAHIEVALPSCDGTARYGATHCHMHLERYRQDLRRALVPAPLAGLGIDRVNAYLSPPGAGAALHFDARTVVIVQLAGRKLWEVSSAPAVEAPGGNCVAPPAGRWAPYEGRLLEIPDRLVPYELGPGDWLVVTKATWHRTVTTCGSVSVTLALPD